MTASARDSDLVGPAVLFPQFSEFFVIRDRQGDLELRETDKRLHPVLRSGFPVALHTHLCHHFLWLLLHIEANIYHAALTISAWPKDSESCNHTENLNR